MRPLASKILPWHIRSAALYRALGVGPSRDVISLPGLGSHAVKLIRLYGSRSGRCASVQCRRIVDFGRMRGRWIPRPAALLLVSAVARPGRSTGAHERCGWMPMAVIRRPWSSTTMLRRLALHLVCLNCESAKISSTYSKSC